MKFNNGNFAEEAFTVRDVIFLLSQLDPEMPVHQGFEESVDVVIVNSDYDNPHIEFMEGGDFSSQQD